MTTSLDVHRLARRLAGLRVVALCCEVGATTVRLAAECGAGRHTVRPRNWHPRRTAR